PRLIREFQLQYPAIEISLFEGTDSEVSEWVQTRVAHAGFAALPVKGLSTIPVTRDEWMAVLPPKDPSPRITLAALAKRKFLLSGGGCESLIRSLFEDASLDLPQSRLLIKQMATIEAMVSEGLGVSLVPATALAHSKKVRTVPLSPKRYRSIGLLLPPTRTHSPLITAWISVVRSFLAIRK
ncbi:MAG TPA: LysR family transcriptional regulator substrate-binding protein, partial [Bryobacteraceae bacterium]